MPSTFRLDNEVTRFLGVGVAATALQYLVYGALLRILPGPAVVASVLGYVAGSVLSYLLNYHVTFGSSRAHASAVPRFYAMVAVAFLLNAAIVGGLVDGMGLNAWLGQVVATVACLAWNYAVSRRWVFGTAKQEEAR
ncbi:MAG TPA: GtrA family protein [Ramlibacter sp.]|nr:GtrA family protein [Ramlibacter sp.]